ncbi:MAG: Signal recognition particle receptor FtsY [Thermoleophilia bacterium]|nr:Signal recognition particle receptor FtsY [Thermoleophilia bacterium]
MRAWNDLFIGLDRADAQTDAATAAAVATREEQGSGGTWFGRFRDSLARSRRAMTAQLAVGAFDPADHATWERIEEGLIAADVGVTSTVAIVERLEAEAAAGRLVTAADLAAGLRRVAAELMVTERSGRIDLTSEPTVVMMVGVNGTGKTTSIGKIASRLRTHGHDVVIAAGDTFRAAAAEQLEVWAERSGSHFVRTKDNGDPAAVAWDALEKAKSTGAGVVLLDTAGRLHTKTNLMAELEKVRRVLEKQLPGAPHETLLSIDATTGQNGMRQAKEFASAVDVTGIVLTKLDGTAKGGIAVAIANELGIPIKLIGIGEGVDDLQPFDPDEFLRALFPDDLLDG